ncbi:MAG: aminoglycoside phosphotransferase family protein [Desulfovibrionaceae bacterium]|jgi:hypothetical protein|nr:aminoglycoside phosphotransferase family protein [Desulfovibrionaceae bacterium]
MPTSNDHRATPNGHRATARAAADFLRGSGWAEALGGLDAGGWPDGPDGPDRPGGPDGPDGPDAVRFLAAGEYNENYRVRLGGRDYVLRINHGTQLGLADQRGQHDQIGYEFRVLELAAPSGVTPRPLFVESAPADPHLGRGVLLMDFLPGAPLDYARDTATAARIFARVHAVEIPPDHGLVVQADAVGAIAAESEGLLARYPDHPLTRERDRLLAFRDEILALRDATLPLFADEPPVLVNTEVNSHNFLIPRSEAGGGAPASSASPDAPGAPDAPGPRSPAGGFLVDWEKAVLSTRHQDLGHFLVITTTRWKRDHVYDEAAKRAFLRDYLAALTGRAPGPDELDGARERTRVLERAILLRALSWCHMAYYEYTRAERALRNAETFARIRDYLDGMEWLLA